MPSLRCCAPRLTAPPSGFGIRRAAVLPPPFEELQFPYRYHVVIVPESNSCYDVIVICQDILSAKVQTHLALFE